MIPPPISLILPANSRTDRVLPQILYSPLPIPDCKCDEFQTLWFYTSHPAQNALYLTTISE